MGFSPRYLGTHAKASKCFKLSLNFLQVEADSMLPAIVCAMMPSNIIRLVIGGAENEEHK
jgi:hypothetical protein